MKNAYKVILGFILVLATMGGLSCVDVSNSTSGSVTTTTPVVGSGNIVEDFRSVTGATGVDLQSVANLKIVQGTPEELILIADDNILPLILTDVQNGILVIRNSPGFTLQPSQRMEANLTLSNIDSITLSGVGNITVGDLVTTQIELTQSGVGDIEILNLEAQALDVLISGLGDISVDGQVNDQIIALISAGNYQAENLVSATVDVEIADSGSATVRVSTTLNADITGTGSVFYHGSPVVNRTGNGTGKIIQLSP